MAKLRTVCNERDEKYQKEAQSVDRIWPNKIREFESHNNGPMSVARTNKYAMSRKMTKCRQNANRDPCCGSYKPVPRKHVQRSGSFESFVEKRFKSCSLNRSVPRYHMKGEITIMRSIMCGQKRTDYTDHAAYSSLAFPCRWYSHQTDANILAHRNHWRQTCAMMRTIPISGTKQ